MTFNFNRLVQETLSQLYPDSGVEVDGEIFPDISGRFGDVSISVAQTLARRLRRDATSIAGEIAEHLAQHPQVKADPSKGYVNVRFTDQLLEIETLFGRAPGHFTKDALNEERLNSQGMRNCYDIKVIPPALQLSRLGFARMLACAGVQALCLRKTYPHGLVEVSLSTMEIRHTVENVASVVRFIQAVVLDESAGQQLGEPINKECRDAQSAWGDGGSADALFRQFIFVADDAHKQATAGDHPGVGNVCAANDLVACSQELLLHTPPGEEHVLFESNCDRWWQSFLLLSISDVPGREFIPSACQLGGDEDVVTQIENLRSRLQRRSSAWSCGVDRAKGERRVPINRSTHMPSDPEPSAKRSGAIVCERSALVAALALAQAIHNAAAYGRIEDLGALLFRLLRDGTSLMNTRSDEVLGASPGNPLSYVYSCIYQALGDVLTVVEQ